MGSYPNPPAVDALLKLARDPDDDVRDWATFGLGSLHDIDTPEVRQCMWENLQDRDADVRAEAVAGLAQRGDPRAVDCLLDQLSADCRWQDLEAAEKLASPRLLPALHALASEAGWADGDWRHVLLGAAIEACTPAQSVDVAPPSA